MLKVLIFLLLSFLSLSSVAAQSNPTLFGIDIIDDKTLLSFITVDQSNQTRIKIKPPHPELFERYYLTLDDQRRPLSLKFDFDYKTHGGCEYQQDYVMKDIQKLFSPLETSYHSDSSHIINTPYTQAIAFSSCKKNTLTVTVLLQGVKFSYYMSNFRVFGDNLFALEEKDLNSSIPALSNKGVTFYNATSPDHTLIDDYGITYSNERIVSISPLFGPKQPRSFIGVKRYSNSEECKKNLVYKADSFANIIPFKTSYDKDTINTFLDYNSSTSTVAKLQCQDNNMTFEIKFRNIAEYYLYQTGWINTYNARLEAIRYSF